MGNIHVYAENDVTANFLVFDGALALFSMMSRVVRIFSIYFSILLSQFVLPFILSNIYTTWMF